jgi:murein DD-endopeptidase MepM/ murein hydrolase activator NlpD
MKKQVIFLSVLIVFVGFSLKPCFADHIEKNKKRWKIFYKNITPNQTVKQWKVPFKTKNRTDLSTISIISTFGAPRLSYVRGHFHTGVDMIPKKNNGQHIYVYPMAAGVVCSIHLGDPHRTVVVKHQLANGETLYTSYKHFQEVYVTNGQQVTHETPLARLYTRSEARAQGGRYDHLHLETRKKFDDYGVASWATMTKADLNLRFSDPWKFMKDNIKLILSE